MHKKNNPMWAFIFNNDRRARRHDMAVSLRGIPLFAGLSKRELRVVGEIVHQRSYQAGEFIFKKGQPGAAMFIITAGGVDIIDHGTDEDTVLASIGAGTFFGELALLDDSPRSASAMATQATEIYAFFRGDFLDLLKSAPQIGAKVYRELAVIIGARLKATNEQLFDR